MRGLLRLRFASAVRHTDGCLSITVRKRPGRSTTDGAPDPSWQETRDPICDAVREIATATVLPANRADHSDLHALNP